MSEKQTGSGLLGWIDARFPLTKMYEEHLGKYYAPKNFNFWYFFGSLALLVLVLQIVTGIFLTMHYKPDGDLAFASVEHIMRDVDWGWLIRYLHSTDHKRTYGTGILLMALEARYAPSKQQLAEAKDPFKTLVRKRFKR
ncbi:MAG: hypothetical protein ACO3DT_17765, partial [Gammaproteobacteria bacterium]